MSWDQGGGGKQKDEGKTVTASCVARGPGLNIKPKLLNILQLKIYQGKQIVQTVTALLQSSTAVVPNDHYRGSMASCRRGYISLTKVFKSKSNQTNVFSL